MRMTSFKETQMAKPSFSHTKVSKCETQAKGCVYLAFENKTTLFHMTKQNICDKNIYKLFTTMPPLFYEITVP